MTTLWLHIGHGKTGSSYLQSCFAFSRKELAANGLHYPWHRNIRQAAKGQTTSGNGRFLIRALDSGVHRAAFVISARALRRDWLLSSEFLVHRLSRPDAAANLKGLMTKAGFSRIRMLLFIRDPEAHLMSAWHQWINADGFEGGIDDALTRYRVPMVVERVITAFADHPDVDLTVCNYDRITNDVRGSAQAWLDSDQRGTLGVPADRVNRTRNSAEKEALPAKTRARLWQKVGPSIQKINQALPAPERYRIPSDISLPDGVQPGVRSPE